MDADSGCGHTGVRIDRADLVGRILYFGGGRPLMRRVLPTACL
jgi:hypothetical protein